MQDALVLCSLRLNVCHMSKSTNSIFCFCRAEQELEAALEQLEAAEADSERLRAELAALQAAGQTWGREQERLQALDAELGEARGKVWRLCMLEAEMQYPNAA